MIKKFIKNLFLIKKFINFTSLNHTALSQSKIANKITKTFSNGTSCFKTGYSG